MAIKLKFPDNSTYQCVLDKHLKSGMFAIMLAGADDVAFEMVHTEAQHVLVISQGEADADESSQICIGMDDAEFEVLSRLLATHYYE